VNWYFYLIVYQIFFFIFEILKKYSNWPDD